MSIISGGGAVVGAGGAAAGGYQISRSLRFNSAYTAYLSRTGGTSTNRKIHTFSFWTKYSVKGGARVVASAGSDDNNREWLGIDSNKFAYQVKDSSNFYDVVSTQVFRDPSAWYHFVVAVDTTQATSSNRVKIYVNDSQITAFDTANYPPQNDDLFFNDSVGGTSYIGALRGFVSSTYAYDGYITEFNFIDGQALTPSDFGETNPTTGVWQPIEYTGTYGTNGFYLPFSDNTSTTTLGYDAAGSNDWTPNNFSVTAGAGNDSLVDSPTRYGTDTGAGGTVRGNYATLNPLDKNTNVTLSNGNLYFSVGATPYSARATFGMSSGKWYWEIQNPSSAMIGIMTASGGLGSYVGADANGWGYYFSNGEKYNNGSSSAYGNSYTNTDVIGVAFDADNGKLFFSKNGTWQASGDPAAGTNAAYTGLTSGPYFAALGNGSQTSDANFGQRPFAYAAPTGFKALVTTNLPTPTIAEGKDYFNAVTWTGTGGARTITGVGFQPDLVWAKSRSTAINHFLQDTLRGANKVLASSTTNPEYNSTTDYSDGGLGTSTSDGFTIVAGTANANNLNQSSATYVAWNWKANGAGSTNTAGTITSTVSVNTTAGFSIITYTGTGANATVGHGLGVAPSMVIAKKRDGTADSWQVYHANANASPATGALFLNTNDGFTTSATSWNNTAPTSTVISIGTVGRVNNSGSAYVMYAFAPVAGFSSISSYVGNGSTDGVFVYTGFRPRFVMVKRSSAAGDPWQINDTARNPSNLANLALHPNASDSEYTYGSAVMDILSNGFKLRGSDAYVNASGSTYIFMAFAENPFAYSLAR